MMDATVIGVDAHKRSHTAVVLDDEEQILDQLRLVADRRQTDRLLAWAARWPDRVFAIENARGLGRLLAQQLVGSGEMVVDVPGRLTARTRRLSGHSARKSDEFDARSVAIVGANHTNLMGLQQRQFWAMPGTASRLGGEHYHSLNPVPTGEFQT